MRRSRENFSFAPWGHCHVGRKPAAEVYGSSGGVPGLLTIARSCQSSRSQPGERHSWGEPSCLSPQAPCSKTGEETGLTRRVWVGRAPGCLQQEQPPAMPHEEGACCGQAGPGHFKPSAALQYVNLGGGRGSQGKPGACRPCGETWRGGPAISRIISRATAGSSR